MNIEAYLKEKQQRVNQALRDCLSLECPPRLKEAMQYSVEAGGKRIRSILAIAACEACGGSEAAVMPAACALELIHTFSLIHDDLPAMDNDDLRRGKPTNHKMFGDGTAILAGDGLLAHAFWVLARHNIPSDILEEIAEAAGPRGIVGGQQLDLEGEGKTLSAEALEKIHRYKTGRLITSSVVCGARTALASPVPLEHLKKYGERVGLAFQIADDLLNVEGSPADTGKQATGSDQTLSKATYPAILGVEASRKEAARLVGEALAALSSLDAKADPLRHIAQFIISRKS